MYKPVPCGDVEGLPGGATVRVTKWPRQRSCRPFLCLAFLAILLFVAIAGVLLYTSANLPSNGSSRRLIIDVDGPDSGGKNVIHLGRDGGDKDADVFHKIMGLMRGNQKEMGTLRIKEEHVGNLTALLQFLKAKVGSGTLGLDLDDGVDSRTNIGNINVFNINVVNSNNNNNNDDLNNDSAQSNNNLNNVNSVINSVNNNVNNLVNSNDDNNNGNNNNNFDNNNDGKNATVATETTQQPTEKMVLIGADGE